MTDQPKRRELLCTACDARVTIIEIRQPTDVAISQRSTAGRYCPFCSSYERTRKG